MQDNLPDTSFTVQEVYRHLHTPNLHINIVPVLTSTNTILAQMAQNGAPEGTVLAALAQSAGRGRLGKSFASPENGGLYFTLLLRPPFNLTQAQLLTPAAAVCMAQAIESTCHLPIQIKWVNDLYLGGKKICGILTETMPRKNSPDLDYVLIGIGVNIYPAKEQLPPELSTKATTIFPQKPTIDYRPLILAAFLDNFFAIYPTLPHDKLFFEYKKRLFILGQNVEVITANQHYTAQVLDLNDDFSLLVRTIDGHSQKLFSGEIQLKIH